MRKKIVAFLLAAACLSMLAGCSAQKSSKREIYVYDDFCYYLYVPIEYENSISQVSSRNVLINFSSDIYLSIKVQDYYGSLDKSIRANTERSEYSYGDKSLDDTFNSQSYIAQYVENIIKSMVGVTNISGITVTEINGREFWLVGFDVYNRTEDPLTHEVTEKYKGQGNFYITVDDGYVYQLLLCANNGYITDSPDAIASLHEFHIGAKVGSAIIYLWVFIGLIIVACLLFVVSRFVKVEVVTDDEPESGTRVLGDIRNAVNAGGSTDKAEKENERILYNLDIILGRKETQDFDIDTQLQRNELVREKLGKLLKKHEETAALGAELDRILGREKKLAITDEAAVDETAKTEDAAYASDAVKDLKDKDLKDTEAERENAVEADFAATAAFEPVKDKKSSKDEPKKSAVTKAKAKNGGRKPTGKKKNGGKKAEAKAPLAGSYADILDIILERKSEDKK